jgi:hypothetical protein
MKQKPEMLGFVAQAHQPQFFNRRVDLIVELVVGLEGWFHREHHRKYVRMPATQWAESTPEQRQTF